VPTVGSKPGNSPLEMLEEKLLLARSVWLRSKRYWPLLPVSLVLACLGGWAAPKLMKPQYKSEVILTVRQRMESRALQGLQDQNERSWKDRLREYLMSAPNLKEVIEKEHLQQARLADVGMPRTIETVRQKISFSAGGETFIIGYEGNDASVVQRAAARLGEQLIEEVRRQSSERLGSTRAFLEREERRLREELRRVDAAYAGFISQHPEFAPEDSPSALGRAAGAREPASAAAVATGLGSYGALQRQANRLRRRLDQLNTPSSASLPPGAPAEPELTPESKAAIEVATQQVQRAARDYDSLKTRYTERHPDVVRARTQLAAAQAELRRVKASAVTLPGTPAAEMQALAPPDPKERQSLTRQLRQVEAALVRRGPSSPQKDETSAAQTEEGADTIVGLETRWAEINRQRQGLRAQHDQIQNDLFNSNVVFKAQAVGGGTELVVAEPAYLPKLPSSRGPRRTAGIAAGVILMLGVGVMLGLGFLDQRILTEWDLTRLDLAPIVTVVPSLDSEKGARRS
jgi:capsular polysaccharide biosynthesis protein